MIGVNYDEIYGTNNQLGKWNYARFMLLDLRSVNDYANNTLDLALDNTGRIENDGIHKEMKESRWNNTN